MKISQTVFELQSGHDFVTDDQGKNNMSPNPTGGDIIKIWWKKDNPAQRNAPIKNIVQGRHLSQNKKYNVHAKFSHNSPTKDTPLWVQII